jgi:hypothetical protein
MTGALKRTTPNYNIPVPKFDETAWQGFYEQGVDIIDAAIFAFTGININQGVWDNATVYAVNDRAVDADNGTLWSCLVGHTSASSGTFAADRAANSSYWAQVTSAAVNGGTWTTSTAYATNTYIEDGYRVGIVTNDYTSGASYNADVSNGDVVTIVDLTSQVAPIAAISSEIATVAGISTNVTTVAAIEADISTVAGDSTDIQALGAISTNITTVAGISADVTTVAGISTNVTAVASNVTSVNNFADRYQVETGSDPTLRADGSALEAGDLLYRSDTGTTKIYDGTAYNVAVFDVDGAVFGPASSTNNYVPQWNGANGDTLKAGLAVGTGANRLLQLDGSGRIPAINASLVTDLTKSQVGLGNVDNTSDANKPVSTATQTALDGKAATSHTHSNATTGTAGFMSASDKTKLDAVGTMANRAFTVSTSDPSGGSNGDIWFKVT